MSERNGAGWRGVVAAVVVLVAAGACTGDGAIQRSSTARPRPPSISSAARQYLDYALELIQHNDYYAQHADWVSIRRRAYRLAAGAKQPSDVYEAIRKTLQGLGDRHGFLITADQMAKWDRLSRRVKAWPSARERGRVGYLDLPGFTPRPGSGKARHYVDLAWRGLGTIRAACGWVVDLRDDGGGDVYPMLAALEPLFRHPRPVGVQFVGGWVSWFHVIDGRVSEDNFPGGVDYGGPPPPVPGRLAILIGPQTASAGEITLIGLRSRPNTRVFGSPTWGGPAAPTRFTLWDGATLEVTLAVAIDPARHLHPGRIVPDERMPWRRHDGQDPVFEAARRWLLIADGERRCAHVPRICPARSCKARRGPRSRRDDGPPRVSVGGAG